VLIERDRSLLLVDVQERLVPAMAEPAGMLANCALLLKSAARLGVPILASEQYPQGLGPTVAELRALLPEGAICAKTAFACTTDPEIQARLRAAGRAAIEEFRELSR
jgi:nicotinamidase-related amidase